MSVYGSGQMLLAQEVLLAIHPRCSSFRFMDLPVWVTAFASSFTPDPSRLFHELQKFPALFPKRKQREDGESITKLSCFRHLGAHLFHELAHGRDVAWRAAFDPFLISLRSFFQVGAERPGDETLPETWNDRLDHLPYAEKLPAGFEEQVLMQQVVVEQSTGLFPITDNHAGERSRFRTHRSDPHGVLQAGHMIVFEKPVTGLAQLGLASLIVNLKM